MKYIFPFFVIILQVYIILGLVIYLAQDHLLFPKQPLAPKNQQWLAQTFPNAEITFLTPDQIQLQGWLLRSPQATAEKTPLLIYFGGNAEEVSTMAWHMEHFPGWSLLLINYRGYGLSEGNPSQQHLFADALTIYDTISQRTDIDQSCIVAMGRSLGTGVAVHLAAQRPLDGVILISPYDSVTAVAKQIYFFLPVSLLLKHPFNSIAQAPQITAPMLTLVAKEDSLIKPSHSYRLAEHWQGPHEVQELPAVNHDTIMESKGFWPPVEQFLNQRCSTP
ncbi:MAG: alpha/beta hydrolase [Pseudomonadota bacterium]|nr:alpha/beta hydrolase [Pseudomonadota bacterium]